MQAAMRPSLHTCQLSVNRSVGSHLLQQNFEWELRISFHTRTPSGQQREPSQPLAAVAGVVTAAIAAATAAAATAA